MVTKLKKSFLCIFFSVLFLFSANSFVFAQDKNKYSPSYLALGRELTKQEIASYGNDLTRGEIEDTFLPREQKLVIVRAVVAAGSGQDVNRVLEVYQNSGLQSFKELVGYFKSLKEKYGSVKGGVEAEFVLNRKDNEEAFKEAATKAYFAVFGISEDQQDKEKIFAFLKSRKALEYSKMLEVFLGEMDSDTKRNILFLALDQSGRPDLKSNEKFVTKLLEQEFTYEALMELFKELKKSAPSINQVQAKKKPKKS